MPGGVRPSGVTDDRVTCWRMTTSGAGRLKEKAVVTLVDAGAEALALRRGET
jgi:hypothetical protein